MTDPAHFPAALTSPFPDPPLATEQHIHAEPAGLRDYVSEAPEETGWRAEIELMRSGAHPDPAGFLDSVERLTDLEWAMSEVLVEHYAHAEPLDDGDHNWGQHLWFHIEADESDAKTPGATGPKTPVRAA